MNTELARCKNVCVIGIDRGVRHLAYYSVIDSEGNIIEQDSFHVIRNEYNGTTYETDYHYILSQKEKERDESRKSWESIGKIKEVKEGYLSQVVHKIAQLMVKHNAIVVFEDLNLGFKRGQMKFERQVYQKLEKMLIDKLNDLVFKDRTPNEPGGVLNAYQLAEPFKGFKYMGKQTGFIFYVQAANTSKIDPVTGFTNFIYPKYENEIQAKELIAKFTSIRYNKENDYFEFTASHNSFVKNEEAKLDRDKEWIICTYGKERWHFNTKSKTSRNVPQYLCEDVSENLKKLFVENGIQYENGVDIKNSILNSFNAKFYETLLWNLRIVLQLRYTYKDKDGEQDYILSPVAPFFDSRKANATQPQNADANGAYNIAKKGLLVLKRLRGEEGYEKYDKKGKPDLFITNKEWLEFAQNKVHTLTN